MDFQTSRRTQQMLRGAILVSIFSAAVWGIALRHRSPEQNHNTRVVPLPSATYVGAERCAACHPQAAETWRQSDHALAMQEATDSTVLGNFRNTRFTKDGLTSSLYLKEGKHYVRTDGPDGRLGDYPVAYTFGVFPL